MPAAIPLLPCTSLQETLDFYRTLGFAITYQQTEPYLYAAIQQSDLHLHFSRLSAYGAKNAFGACLVFVPAVSPVHRAFADSLRTQRGRVPTAGVPRITRLRPGDTRFKLFDPSGNLLIYIDADEAEGSYQWSEKAQSPLALALENAIFLRDTYANDQAAAKVLEKALASPQPTAPLERALALAALAELAVALGDESRALAAEDELSQILLSDAERQQYHTEFHAAAELRRWITSFVNHRL